MKSSMILTSGVFLTATVLPCFAGPTATISVTARIVQPCTAIGDDVADCSSETLRFQSTLPGSADFFTTGGNPSIQFVGPLPIVERDQNRLTVLF